MPAHSGVFSEQTTSGPESTLTKYNHTHAVLMTIRATQAECTVMRALYTWSKARVAVIEANIREELSQSSNICGERNQ